MPPNEVGGACRSLDEEGEGDEWDAQPDAVAERQQRAAHGAGFCEREGLHGGERRSDTRRPPEPEQHAESRRSDNAPLRHPHPSVLPLEPGNHPHECETHGDHQKTHDAGNDVLVSQER